MTVYTVTSRDDRAREASEHCVAGSYTTCDAAINGCARYIMERLGLRDDLAYSMAHDENHPEAAKYLCEGRKDKTWKIRRGCREKLFSFLREELAGRRYYVYDGNNSWYFDIDANKVEGKMWMSVTWGDSDCEDPDFTTPRPQAFMSEESAIQDFYEYAVDLRKDYGIPVSEGFKAFVYETLQDTGRCQVDLDDGCCVSCVLYRAKAEDIA